MNILDYLRNPCGGSSVPYWKIDTYPVPEFMRIVHDRDFEIGFLEMFADEPYFRLIHGLDDVKEPTLPAGFSWTQGSMEQFADHINSCYTSIGVSAAELSGYSQRPTYDDQLWLAIRENDTGKIVATGIGEVDRQVGEGMLEWVQVTESYRGRGLGKAIVLELLIRMQGKVRFATVSGQCSNPHNPEKMYRACGFTGDDIWHVLVRK